MAFLQGSTVALRPIEESDLEFVQAGLNHPAVRSFLGQRLPTSIAQERDYLEAVNDRDDAVQLLIVTDGEPVGVVEFDPIDREAGVTDLAVWIHPDHQGHGAAREAVELMCTYAFDELRLHKVTADAYATNEASRGLFESLGFTQEGAGREDAFFDGRYQDSVYYGLLEDEWREREGGYS
jgi:RimJ/RimL family protein N-acetyltransferase